jgi:putative membrane protein
MMDGWDMNGWGWAWMSLWMALGIAVVVLLGVLVVRGATAPPPRPEDDAVATLRRRFASGEIDRDEYRRRRAELESRL